jgi:hypothetical protein
LRAWSKPERDCCETHLQASYLAIDTRRLDFAPGLEVVIEPGGDSYIVLDLSTRIRVGGHNAISAGGGLVSVGTEDGSIYLDPYLGWFIQGPEWLAFDYRLRLGRREVGSEEPGEGVSFSITAFATPIRQLDVLVECSWQSFWDDNEFLGLAAGVRGRLGG